MSTLLVNDPLDSSEPPLSPTMERAFSEAFADILEMEMEDDQPVIIKMETSKVQQNWPRSDKDATSTNVRMATLPPTTMTSGSRNQGTRQDNMGSMSPVEKELASFKDADEERRARRSAIEKKSRQRRQNELKHMRKEVKQLEGVYADMYKTKEAGTAGLVKWRGLTNLNASSATDELQQKYSELTLVAHALEEDQAALQKLMEQHGSFQKKLKRLSAESEFIIYDSGIPPSSSFEAKFRPISMAEGYAFVRESYEEIKKFTETNSYETTGASFMGWTDKRKYVTNTQLLQYSFTKQFPFGNTEKVFMKSWETFLDPSELAKLAFDSSVQTRFEVLQVLNDDLIIMRRDHKIPHFPSTFTSVQVLFRLQTPTGYTVCIRTIPAPEIKNALEAHEYLFNVFHWTHFNRLYDEYDNPAGCEIVTAGSIEQTKLRSTYWLFELVCSVMRWESMTVAPLFMIET
ncbi:hypothetical protein PRIC2_006043 [Phytophthora ramorum]